MKGIIFYKGSKILYATLYSDDFPCSVAIRPHPAYGRSRKDVRLAITAGSVANFADIEDLVLLSPLRQ